ncbi:hypothetical protein FRC07_014440 [Ceratobasidium sp. 392]|nr:hypothetical protein FRC07_014440 [Ceratobasidium sp. 392]
MAWATSSITGDTNHLYIEIKNGKVSERSFAAQMRVYLILAVDAIPPTMTDPVHFLLLNGVETLVWELNQNAVIGNAESVIEMAQRWTTMGTQWWNLMQDIAGRIIN